MKIYRDGESLWKKDAACSKNDTWTFRVIIHRFSCSFFFARTKHSFELVNLSPSSIRARMEISTRKKGSSHCVFFDTTSSSFFFSFFFFFYLESETNIPDTFMKLFSTEKRLSENRNTWTRSSRDYFLLVLTYHFLFRPEREMSHPTGDEKKDGRAESRRESLTRV